MSDDIETRPKDSNADAWHLFLSEYLDARANSPSGMTFMAVQIAEAIDDAERRGASSQRTDAETMEERYRSDRDSLRKALDDRHAADKKAWSAIMRATGKERGLPDNKEVIAFYVAEVERLEKERSEWKVQACILRDKCQLLEIMLGDHSAKLDRAKEALNAAKNCIGVHCPQGVATPLAEHTYAVIDAIISELSADAPARQTQISDEVVK